MQVTPLELAFLEATVAELRDVLAPSQLDVALNVASGSVRSGSVSFAEVLEFLWGLHPIRRTAQHLDFAERWRAEHAGEAVQ